MLNYLRRLKVSLLQVRAALYVQAMRLTGIHIGRSCLLTGKTIFIRKYRSCHITLEDDVVLHSDPKCNYLIEHPCKLCCVAPNAEIILRKGCGLSGCTIICSTRIEIGEHSIIGAGSTLYDCKQHEYRPECGWRKSPIQNEGKPITIGKRCFIGMNCRILKGVSIGDNCIISAGTIITRDVPAGHLAAGNPAVYYPLSERLRTTPDGIVPLPPLS